MLILSDSALAQWYDEEAVAYLHEQAIARKLRQGVLEIE